MANVATKMTYSYIDPSLEEIIEDLAEYTHIPKETVRNLVINREPYCYKREFTKKQNFETNDFFNLSSKFFLFGNAKHENVNRPGVRGFPTRVDHE